MAPATLYDETLRALDEAGLTAYTEFFRGDYLGAGDVAARMREWWDLDALTGLYAEFCAAWRPVARDRSAWPPERAFATYVPMLTSWRRLPYLDPGLPLEHLPGRLAGHRGGGAVRVVGRPAPRGRAHPRPHDRARLTDSSGHHPLRRTVTRMRNAAAAPNRAAP